MWEFVYETKNDGGTRARFQKPPAGSGAPGAMNASWGICAAMSAVWLKTVAGGDLVSRPNRNRALILSGKWENKIYAGNVDIKQFNLGLLEDAGLRPGRPRSMTAWATALEVKTAPGSYYISLGNHGIAVMTAPGASYYFDPNYGMWKTSVVGDLDELAEYGKYYQQYPNYNPSWLLIKVTND